MSSDALKTYLNDHLAGSVAALELLDHLADIHSESDRKRFFTGLKAEIEEDQNVLQQLLEKVGGKESPARKAAAWLTEKIGRVKLRLDDLGDELRVLEAIETLGQRLQAARVALATEP